MTPGDKALHDTAGEQLEAADTVEGILVQEPQVSEPPVPVPVSICSYSYFHNAKNFAWTAWRYHFVWLGVVTQC